MKLFRTKFGKKVWKLLLKISPAFCVEFYFLNATGGKRGFLNLFKPTRLDHKINYLKLRNDNKALAKLADKYAVREYVKERGLEEILIPLYGKYDSGKELRDAWDTLPEKFIIKPNNGCGEVRVVEDKSKVDLQQLTAEIDGWLSNREFGFETVELQYTLIPPCVVVEELLRDDSLQNVSFSLVDYKIWCFDGKPYCILACFNRKLGVAHVVDFDMYDLEWNHIPYGMVAPPATRLPKPKGLDKMLSVAAKLAEGHKQVRVDLYDINGKIYFGEMTFTAHGGCCTDYSIRMLEEMGRQFEV